MITRVQDIYYNVQDMDRAVAFYTRVLGLRLLNTDPYWTNLDLGGIRIGLHATDAGAPVPRVPRDAHGAHAGATLTLHSTDLVADTNRLRTAGVTILGELDEAWGKLVVFEDTEGNVLKLMQPPA
jgi:catechol 2,3-dioxygenase-like lactoylglutathione lyase family enzyme